MTKLGLIGLMVFSTATLGTAIGSYSGMGLPRTTKQPRSVKEQSKKATHGGYFRHHRRYHRTYFIGGGTRWGK